MNVAEIQRALGEQQLDGWLFFDHHARDPLAYRVLGFEPDAAPTRRWYYLIPAKGEPRGLVHKVEPFVLDALPGAKITYSSWARQREGLATLLSGCRKIAMQYSPDCAIPYVSLVDAGTIEMVRALGLEVASSANLVQLFEARWSAEQFQMHLAAGRMVDSIRRAAFGRIADRLRAGGRVDEFEIKQFILESFDRAGLETDHGPIVAVNANCSNPHYEPGSSDSSAIEAGDWVLLDMWAKLRKPHAVYYDITWTGYCGSDVPATMRQVFDIVAGARDAAISSIRHAFDSGRALEGWEVDDVARGFITERGYGDFFIHRTGHSIGADVHGAGVNIDNLETHDERTLSPGVCFSIEPGIYLPAFGVRSEVNVFMGQDGPQVTGEKQTAPVLIV